jgi:hypothetical protein
MCDGQKTRLSIVKVSENGVCDEKSVLMGKRGQADRRTI